MKTVAQITYYYSPIVGGQQVYVEELNGVLHSLGYDASVVQRWRKDATGGPRVLFAPALPYAGKVFGRWDWHLFTIGAWLRYSRLFESRDALIVHYAVHTPSVWNLGQRTIVLSHGVEWAKERSGLEDRLRRWIALKSFRRFVVVANDTDYLREMGLPVTPTISPFTEVVPRVWYIPNCVDVERFKPLPNRSQSSARRTVIVPRQITADRGIDLAIRVLGELKKLGSEYSMLFVGGPTKGKYYKSCVSLASQLGLAESLTFVGPRSHEEMPMLIGSASACLIPTLRREGTSLSALEAMSCGVPTVTTDVAGLQDLPSQKCPIDPVALARALHHSMNDGGEIGRLQEATVRSTYTMQNWRLAWARVLDSLDV